MRFIEQQLNPEFWKKVRECDDFTFFRDEVTSVWKTHCDAKPLRTLRYRDYKLFFTTGNRTVYEKPFFSGRMGMHASAFLALMYPENEEYLTDLMDIIFAICDEYTWCLPAHQGQNEYNDNSHIDLMAAETAFALAEIYTLLYSKLDPVIRSRVETEIERRVFTPYENEEPCAHWENWTNNWISVCTASIAGAYMLMKPERAERLIPRFERAMKLFLSGYQDDGICTEGCAYWNYGFGYFVIYADMIKIFTDGKINHFENPKVRQISAFIQNMFLSENSSVSFSDGSSRAVYSVGIQHYLKGLYPEIAVYDMKYASIHLYDSRMCYALRAVGWFNREYYLHPDAVESESDCFAPDTQWMIRKTQHYGFAAKGGNNNEFHNHNDVGSFIFAVGGEHILTDPGSAEYTRQYFANETRYTYFETQSLGHSVPIIGGALQKHGKEYMASDVAFENRRFSLDISSAYGMPELESLERSFDFKDDSVILTDAFTYLGQGDIVERFILTAAPIPCTDGFSVGNVKLLTFDFKEWNLSDRMLKNGKPVYILDLKLPANAKKFTMKIESLV